MSNSRRLRRALAAAAVKAPQSRVQPPSPRRAHHKRWQSAAGSTHPTGADAARSEIHGAGPYRSTTVRPGRARKHRRGSVNRAHRGGRS